MRVFLVDDHEVVRRGVAHLLEENLDISVVGEAGSVAEAMARIPAVRPDVAVLDVELTDGSGVELCRELRAKMPDLNCLILAYTCDEDTVVEAIMAGAAGYFSMDVTGSNLVKAVRSVGAGESLLDSWATAALIHRLRAPVDRKKDPTIGLSDQERIVLDLLGQCLTNREIAERMFLTEKTVKNYVSRLLTKLGMQRRSQAAVLAAELRLSRPSK